MKLPKETKRYCPNCRTHTSQTIVVVKQRGRSSAHPMSRGSDSRLKSRHVRSGMGNYGKYSRPAIKSWKRKVKVTKRFTIMYTCTKCKKSRGIAKGIRAGRIEVGEKVAK